MLNPGKTEVNFLGSKSQLNNVDPYVNRVDSFPFEPKTAMRNLGLILDPDLSLEPYIRNVTKVSFFSSKEYC